MRPLLFNVFIKDHIFLVQEAEIYYYADDTTIYVYDIGLEHIVSSLETDAQRLSDFLIITQNREKAEGQLRGFQDGMKIKRMRQLWRTCKRG